jgi:hypothetical protein
MQVINQNKNLGWRHVDVGTDTEMDSFRISNPRWRTEKQEFFVANFFLIGIYGPDAEAINNGDEEVLRRYIHINEDGEGWVDSEYSRGCALVPHPAETGKELSLQFHDFAEVKNYSAEILQV